MLSFLSPGMDGEWMAVLSLAVQSHLCQDSSEQGALGRNWGTYNPILWSWLTDSNYMQVAGKKQSSVWNLWPWGSSRGRKVVALVGCPQRFHSPVSMSPAPAALPPCFPSTRPLFPSCSLEWENPLVWGLCNNDESLFFSFLRIHLCIPEQAFITLCPGCRHLPPSDSPAQKGSLVRHMKPAPLDIWTRRSPLTEHEAVLNATRWKESPCSWVKWPS